MLLVAWQRMVAPDEFRQVLHVYEKRGYRISDTRLTGFPYAPVKQHRARFEYDPRVSDIARRLEGRTDAQSLRVRAAALLLSGEDRQAVAILEKTVKSNPQDAATWNDLAAARQTVSIRTGDPALLADALGAIRRALLLRPDFPEARFNEGVILGHLGIYPAAVRAYATFLNTGERSGWGAEARSRLPALDMPQERYDFSNVIAQTLPQGDAAILRLVSGRRSDARISAGVLLGVWAQAAQSGDFDRAARNLRSAAAIANALYRLQGDTFLVDCVAAIQHGNDEQRRALISAHVLYSRTYTPGDRGHDVSAIFSAAERNFRTGGSPMWIVAALRRRLSGNAIPSEQVLRELLAASGEAHYVLRAELLFTLASHYAQQERHVGANIAAQQSIQLIKGIGEVFQAAAMAESYADMLRQQQKRSDAWLMHVDAFKGMSLFGSRFLLSEYIDRAARWEAETGHIDSALALLALSGGGATSVHVSMYTNVDINRALAAYRDGRPIGSQILESAAHTAAHVKNEQARQIALNDLKLLDATVRLHSGKPREAITVIDQYFKHSAARESRYFSAEAHFVRALAFRLLGEESKAMNDLRVATGELTYRQRDAMAPILVEFDIHEEVLDELVDILVRRGEIKEAFRTLGATRHQRHRQPVPATEAPQRDLLIVEYLALRDRLLVFIAQHGRVTLRTVRVDEQTLTKTASAFGRDLTRGVEGSAAENLSNWLLAPVRDRVGKTLVLMVIPDRVLSGVPFAALRVNKTQRLVEIIPLAFAPSNALSAPPRPIDPGITLAVGNPTTRFQYAPLPYAHIEAKSVARAYPMSELLLGDQATWENVRKSAENATTLHFATHAIVGEGGLPSQLVLASSGVSSGAWKLDKIRSLRLWRNPVIILAGCRTGAPADRREGRTLALAFIYAGASAVIGTLWDVPDDQASVAVSVRLHQELRAGRDPASALRNVQLSMIRSSNRHLRDPARWSAYQVWSTTRDSFTGVAPWLGRDWEKRRRTKDSLTRCLLTGCRAYGQEVGTRHEHWLRCTEAFCKLFRVHVPSSHVHVSSRQQR